MRNFPYTLEINLPFTNEQRDFFQQRSFRYFKSHEGTIIRVFFYNNQWNIWTTKRPAHMSRWGSAHSFGHIFLIAIQHQTGLFLNNFLKTLDPECQYVFLMTTNTYNRIVCGGNLYSKIFHVGCFVNNVFTLSGKTVGNIPYPEEFIFESVDHLQLNVSTSNPSECQGILAISESTFEFCKIINPVYKFFVHVRGSNPSLFCRYLEICRTDLVHPFMQLYPDKIKNFQYLQCLLFKASYQVYTLYVDRYIHKKYVRVEQPYYSLMKKVHEEYKKSRVNTTHMIVYFIAVSMGEKYIKNPILTKYTTTKIKQTRRTVLQRIFLSVCFSCSNIILD